MVLPQRAVAELEHLEADEHAELFAGVRAAVIAVKTAYRPHGVNVGLNLGVGSGAGVPDHLHVHVLPRWSGDTNFMTSVANTRVLPEALVSTWEKLKAAWPAE
jgi:ATP adenylyltransferase